MTTLNVVLDEMLSPVETGVSRYSRELTRALITYAPPACLVEGIVSASTEQEYQVIEESLPGLHGLFKSALARRDLTAAWQHGFTPVPSGMIHAPSLLAPLRNHDRVHARGNQVAVTIHDVTAWTHPELLPSRTVSWTKAMAQRALKYADAIVVPTHAVAAELGTILDFGDRVRVIGGAVSSSLELPADADRVAEELALPERFLLAMGRTGAGNGIEQLLDALARPEAGEIPLLVVDGDVPSGALQTAALAAGLAPGRVTPIGQVSDAELSVLFDRATAFVYPNLTNGFGMPMLEAFRFGTPVIHSATPSLLEVAGDAGLAVAIDDPALFSRQLADAIAEVLADGELRRRLAILGSDRAKLFSWRGSAESVWQLHADL
jgi:glycosyltransferase involved in cell wall biosynthesis